MMSPNTWIAITLSLTTLSVGTGNAAVQNHRQEAWGLITAVVGSPVRVAPGATKPVALGDRVAIADELQTRQDEMLEILWDRHALILVQPQSSLAIREFQAGETEIALRNGGVRVALAYGGRPMDKVTVETPTSRIFTRGGIMEVDVRPTPPSLLAMVASMFSTPAQAVPQRVDTVRVLEGQSGVETLRVKGASEMVEAGYQARLAVGEPIRVAELPQSQGKGAGLAGIDRRQETPRPLTERLVQVHVDHALEVERLLNNTTSAAIDQGANKPAPDIKGTIVATSLGIPSASLAQPQPSATSPVTSPLPTLPPIQPPTVTALAPNQSGGVNSRNLLKEILREQRDKGTKRGRGRDD